MNTDQNAQNAQNVQGGGINPTTNTNATGQEDYADKGLDVIEKKFGHTQSRNTNEKITDGARNLFEKVTGKKVSEKISN